MYCKNNFVDLLVKWEMMNYWLSTVLQVRTLSGGQEVGVQDVSVDKYNQML